MLQEFGGRSRGQTLPDKFEFLITCVLCNVWILSFYFFTSSICVISHQVLVIIDAKPKDLGLPTDAYVAVEEVHDVSFTTLQSQD